MTFYSQEEICFSQNESCERRIALSNENQIAFPLPEKQAERIDSSNSDGSKVVQSNSEVQAKKKPIRKQKKTQVKKYQKRKKDHTITVQMGRPDNCGAEGLHLKENKSYNDIVYHFARFLIFLKMKQGEERNPHLLNLTFDQNKWVEKTDNIMAQDNYPAYQAEKPHFLLHPNSPHYVFDYLKKKENRIVYQSQDVKFLMIAYLRRKGLLTTTIYHYLCEYWKDILYLVNNPKGDNLPNSIPEDLQVQAGEPQEMASSENNENIESNGRSKGKSEKGKVIVSESALLRKELELDDSIAAYEIACYLHACCEKYLIKINT